jgi:adenylate cyclase
VLEVQDQIVARLSRAIGLSLVDIESRRLAHARPHEPSAIDLVLRAQSTANKPASPENMVAARALFERALTVDPENTDALAGVAATYVFEVLNSYYHDGRQQRLSEAEMLVRKTLDIDPDHVVALKTRAAILRANGKFDDAIAASRAVIARNPGEPWAYKEVGLSELYLGRFEDARSWFDKADRIGPRDPSRWIWLGAMGRIEFILGHTTEAVRLLRLSAEANSKDPRAYALLAAIYALSGQREESTWALTNAVRLRPEITISSLFNDWSVPLASTSVLYRQQHERFRSGLQSAGMRD